MTLGDLLPTLRRTLPAPLAVDAWPELTTPTTTDVVVAGVSMLRYVELCGTPCVHSGAAVLPGTAGVPSSDESSVVVVSITAVSRRSRTSVRVRTDGALGAVPIVWSEARLLARVSSAAIVDVECLDDDGVSSGTVRLPADLCGGDLLVLPCRGTIALGTLRRSARAEDGPVGASWLQGLR